MGTSDVVEICRIVVEDNGIGIEEEVPGENLRAVREVGLHGRSSYEGTGMGLAICRKVTPLAGRDRPRAPIGATSSPCP